MFWKLLPWILRGLALAIVAAVLHYHLPQGEVVRITGTEVKRMDVDSGELRTGEQAGATRDVRFLNAVTADGGTRVYRNEDTGWGFPPYLKFDSADITAEAQDLAGRSGWVLVERYGWRIRVLSMFPNVLDLTEVEAGYEYFPWKAVVILVLIVGLLGAVYVGFLRLLAGLHLEDRLAGGEERIEDLRSRFHRQVVEWRARFRDLRRP
ncbi:DUF1523 family protein [Algihabitans albus]|uniref:DUF1523 family protein n=1 Tax=Algihabitans albus TaxID=2164067 RepID=UPI0013C2CD1A|nr:DUF1523 family protein [Algihabitans albus]